MQFIQHGLLLGRQRRHDTVQEQRCLVQQALGRLDILEHNAFGHGLQARLLVPAQVLAGKHDDRHGGKGGVGLHPVQQVKPGHVGEPQVQHHTIKVFLTHGRQGIFSASGRHDLDILITEQFDNGVALHLVVLNHQKTFFAGYRELLDAVESDFKARRGGFLDKVCKSAVCETVPLLLFHRHNLHGNMAHGRVQLQLVENRPAQHVRQEDIQ